jgi:hypothetical protein
MPFFRRGGKTAFFFSLAVLAFPAADGCRARIRVPTGCFCRHATRHVTLAGAGNVAAKGNIGDFSGIGIICIERKVN